MSRYGTLPIMLILVMVLSGCIGRQTEGVAKKPRAIENVQFGGGSGDSYEDAVEVKGVQKQSQGVEAEYVYISQKHGVKNKDWQIVGQTIVREQGKVFDVIEISLTGTSDRRIYYFDVSSFPWKK